EALEVSAAHADKDDAQQKQRDEEDGRRKDRERREQEQQDKLERMALQAKELEDRLERLSGSMPPAVDPETTHVQGTGATNANEMWVRTGRPEPTVGPGKPMIVDFTPKRRVPPPLLLIGAAVFVVLLAGVGIGAYFMLKPGAVINDPRPSPTPVPSPKAKAELLPI